jgi:hypothetical protein
MLAEISYVPDDGRLYIGHLRCEQTRSGDKYKQRTETEDPEVEPTKLQEAGTTLRGSRSITCLPSATISTLFPMDDLDLLYAKW